MLAAASTASANATLDRRRVGKVKLPSRTKISGSAVCVKSPNLIRRHPERPRFYQRAEGSPAQPAYSVSPCTTTRRSSTASAKPLHVTTMWTQPTHAEAHRSLARYRLSQRSILLLPHAAPPPGCRRLPLGSASRPWHPRPPKSLRHSLRTISAPRRTLRASLCAPATGTRRRNFLGIPLRASRLRPHAPRLHAPADFFRLPLLGRNSHCAMVAHYPCQRLLPAALAVDHGQTANRIARLPRSSQSSRPHRLHHRGPH